MVYNTENGASLQKLPDKSQISGKRQWILLLEIVKKESKTKYFSETTRVDQPEPSVQQEQAGELDRLLELEEMFMMRKLPRTSQTSGNAGSIPK